MALLSAVYRKSWDFEMDELENIFNGSGYGKHPMRILYIDVDMAMKEARPPQ